MQNRIPHSYYLVALLALALAALALASSPATASVLPAKIEPQEGETYYTRHTLMYEKGRHIATNYWVGSLLPINSKVKLVKLKKKSFSLELESGEVIKVANKKKYTQRGIDEIAAELLSPGKVPLSSFSEKTRKKIMAGRLAMGMTKEEAILTRGYPPRHRTPNTDLDTWIYWQNRFVTQTIVFENGRISEGRGLQ